MSDIQRRNELAKEIRELKAKLVPLEKEFLQLNNKLEAEHLKSLPYRFHQGYYSQTKKGTFAVYWNFEDKTFYCKPLYKPNGKPYGLLSTLKTVTQKIAELDASGFTECL